MTPIQALQPETELQSEEIKPEKTYNGFTAVTTGPQIEDPTALPLEKQNHFETALPEESQVDALTPEEKARKQQNHGRGDSAARVCVGRGRVHGGSTLRRSAHSGG